MFEGGVSAEENHAIRRRVPLHGKTDRLLKLSNFVAMHIIKKRYFTVYILFNKQKDCLKRDMKDRRFNCTKFIRASELFRYLLLAKTRSVDLAYVCAKRNLVNVRAFNKDDFLMPVIVLRAIRVVIQ